jgi:tripartite-type tricarboxylate transporter receptor subunit TctC
MDERMPQVHLHEPASPARRRFALSALACAAGLAVPAWAQGFPNRPVRIIVPFPPGGTIDQIARKISTELGERLGQAVVIDNRAGANGIMGTDLVAKSAPDGHSMLLVTASFAVNPSVYRKLPYDVLKDFTPITPVARGVGFVLAVHPSVKANTVAELVKLSKQPGVSLNYSSPGIGNTVHLATEMFKMRTGAVMQHVPYKGSAPALNALLSGEVQVEILPPGIALTNIKSGKVKVLAFTGETRLPEMPDIPTMAEAGVTNMVFEGTWIGLFAPAAVPKPVIDRIFKEMQELLANPEAQAAIKSGGSGYVADGRPPQAFAKQLREDVERYAEVVRAASIEAE